MAKMGRPRKEIDWQLLDSLVGLNASLDYCCEKQLQQECAAIDHKSIRAMQKRIERSIRDRFHCTFVDYRSKKLEPYRLQIFQRQIKLALSGNPTMLIWLGKVFLGQREEVTPVTINASSSNREAALNEIRDLLKAKECSSTPIPPLSLVPQQGLLARS